MKLIEQECGSVGSHTSGDGGVWVASKKAPKPVTADQDCGSTFARMKPLDDFSDLRTPPAVSVATKTDITS